MAYKQELSTEKNFLIKKYQKKELAELMEMDVRTLNKDFASIGIDMKGIRTIHPKYVKKYFESYGMPEKN